MLDRAIRYFMKEYYCERRFAVFLLFGLAVDLAMAVAVLFLFGRLSGFW